RAIAIRRDRVAVAFASVLTPSEAKDLIAFYSSPVGRKMMKAVSNNLVSDSQIDTAFEKDDPKINKAARDQDHQVTVNSTMADLLPNLTREEIRQLEAFGKTPGFRKMDAVGQVLESIPEPSFEEISTPAERDAFRKAIVGALVPAVSGS
ncbi:MAG TPA: DUF2059 domain-containing protein, partial [Novosphingobium sp.]|nr:DUF2059 domain-containing protein [Novosphingobium sp.]